MERCPNCRARTDGGPACRRCGIHLALLQRVERAAEAQLCRAVAALATGDALAARAAANQSLALRRTPMAVFLERFVAYHLENAPNPDL